MFKKIFPSLFALLVIAAVVTAVRAASVPPSVPKIAEAETTPSLPATCVDKLDGTPVITSVSSYSGPVGTKLEITGCNFYGFEGSINVWAKNSQGVKGLLIAKKGSSSKLLKVVLTSPLCQNNVTYSGLPCDAWFALVPGKYKIYTMSLAKKSNDAIFTIK